MKKLYILALTMSLSCAAGTNVRGTEGGKHLFILAGQSNMSYLDPDQSFIPAVSREFGRDNIIVVKDATGGQPIRRWYKKWKSIKGKRPAPIGNLYDRMMKQLVVKTRNRKIKTVTLVWMQGERDARDSYGRVYAASLQGLIDQLAKDLGRKDINFVIGRLSDFGINHKKYPHWNMIRKIQVRFAKEYPRGAWVNTDDLNDGIDRKGRKIKNDLHMSVTGYKKLGERFAAKSIQLIKK